MSSQIKKIKPCEYEVLYSVSGDEFKNASDKALNHLVKNVTIKGFRKGKAPLNLAKERISPNDLINETINQSLNVAYSNILKEHHLNPVVQPSVICTQYNGDSFELKFVISTVPTCKLGQYKGIKIPLEEVSVSKEDVEKAINQSLKDNSELVLKDGPAEIGDTVIFDFKGYVDGKEFEGGSANNYELVLGSNQFVPGFEDQLVGVTSESKKDVVITFPTQYIKDLAGKEAKFVCMIHEIKTKKEPEFNDDFVASLNLQDVSTTAQYEEYKKNELLKVKTNEAKNKQFSELIAKIVEDAEFEISSSTIDKEVEVAKKQTLDQIEKNGLTFEMYKEITGLNDETFNKNLEESSINRIKEYLVINQIGVEEHLTITKDDVDAYYDNVAKAYNMKKEDVIKALSPNERGLVDNLYQNKIERFIMLNNLEASENVEEPKTKEEKVKEPKKVEKKAKTTTKKTTKKTVKKDEE